MQLFLSLLFVLAVKQPEFAVCQAYEESERLAYLHIQTQSNLTEHKVEPEFTYGDKKAYMSCSLTNSTGHNVGVVIGWYKNQTSLSNSKQFIIMENNTLQIDAPTRPLVLDLPRSVNIQEDDNLDLRCVALGYPKPVVTWFRNGITLTASENSSHIRFYDWQGVDNARLVITRAKRQEAGTFKCLAFSAHFNHTSSKELMVRVKDKLAALWPLLGLLGSVILLSVIIASQESRDKARIRKQEAILYSESFINLAAAIKMKDKD